jgi:hypothetical protein
MTSSSVSSEREQLQLHTCHLSTCSCLLPSVPVCMLQQLDSISCSDATNEHHKERLLHHLATED